MDAPKCKLCGERHYGLCEHARTRSAAANVAEVPKPLLPKVRRPDRLARKAVSDAAVAAAPLLKPKKSAPAHDRANLVEEIAPHVYAEVAKPKFDRTAYQREYMRKRRAKAKEAGK